ncbi:MAG: SGNH/GDSL hydrolase family protein [Mucilaginibacter polytrichastri]|nr:SGNH/GDSL hydrolase family protein [Mucilaginibacter polytrichastri]
MRIVYVLLFCLAFTACKKDNPQMPEPAPAPAPVLSVSAQNRQSFFQLLNSGSAKIACEGTSLTYGQNVTEKDITPAPTGYPAASKRSVLPYPAALKAALSAANRKANVVSRGFPGDRTTEGLKRWADSTSASLTIIEFGTNDAYNFAGYSDGTVDTAHFHANLNTMVQRRLAQKSWVILCLPPDLSVGSKDLVPYRSVIRQVAKQYEVPVFDVQAGLNGIGNIWSDMVHLNNKAYKKWGEDIAAFVLAN